MSDINNLYNNLTNFYNVNDENFKEFMAKMYDEMLANHNDVKYVKEHLKEEIVKKLEEYLTDGKFNVNIQQKVEEFINNNSVINNINPQLNNNTKEIKRNKNIKDYRFLCATFRNGNSNQKLIVQGSDDGEKFYEIAPEGCYIPKLASSLRDPSIVKVGEYFYITYTTIAFNKGNTIGFVKTKDFINFENEKLFTIGSFQRIWSPCWFKDGTNLWIIINATNDTTTESEPSGWNV